MLYPTLAGVKNTAEQYRTIPVFWEIPADHWSPLQIFAALSADEDHAVLLESVNTPDREWQNRSYIGVASGLRFAVKKGQGVISAFGSESMIPYDSLKQTAEQFLRQQQSAEFEKYPLLTSGFAGALHCRDHADIPEYEFCLYDTWIAYDHVKSTAVIIQNLHTGSELAAQYQAAEIRAAEIAAKIERFRLPPQSQEDTPPIQAHWSDAETLSVDNAPDSFEVYRRLRSCFPSPYLFYVKMGMECAFGAGNTLTEKSDPGCNIAGFWDQNGIRKTCLAEQAVFCRTWENGDRTAMIECRNPEDAEIIAELMKSAKLENTDIV